MKRLLKKAVRETKITNLLVIDNDNVLIEEDAFSFFEENLLETIRSSAIDDKNGTLVIHCVMDRSSFEQHVGYPVDDATCKVVANAFSNNSAFVSAIAEGFEEVAKDLGHIANVAKVDFEFGDGVFHTIAVMSKG